jgi:hypothetical protein
MVRGHEEEPLLNAQVQGGQDVPDRRCDCVHQRERGRLGGTGRHKRSHQQACLSRTPD